MQRSTGRSGHAGRPLPKRALGILLIAAPVIAVAAVGAVILGFALGAGAATASSKPTKPRPSSAAAGLVTKERVAAVKRVVVIGDSTAAGLGDAPLVHGSADDRTCGRSRDAFAVDLANARHWSVTNLGCSGATIRSGLLGTQQIGRRTLPAQLTTPQVAQAQLVIVDIGANDVEWTSMLALCAVSSSCAGSAEHTYFQDELSGFRADYANLVDRLRQLPSHPVVLVNLYYDPISGDIACLSSEHGTAAKQKALQDDLDGLNAILAAGAKTGGFLVGRPDFAGHGLCSSVPDVQGLTDAAPFHPTAAGERVIAQADERALP
jgi:lysophospholipase L1-like esterase